MPWPGVKGLARRKHRPGKPFSGRLRAASAGRGGPIGRPSRASRDRPYPDREPSRGPQAGWGDRRSLLPGSQTGAGNPRPVGPTGPGNGSRLMVSAGNALDPGPERASKTFTFIRFTESGQGQKYLQISDCGLAIEKQGFHKLLNWPLTTWCLGAGDPDMSNPTTLPLSF